MAFHKIKFEKSHDIKILSQNLFSIYPELENLFKSADMLSQFAVEYRYPDAIHKTVSSSEIEKCLILSEEVYNSCTKKIPFNSSLF